MLSDSSSTTVSLHPRTEAQVPRYPIADCCFWLCLCCGRLSGCSLYMEAFKLPFKVKLNEPRSAELAEEVKQFCYIVKHTLRNNLAAGPRLGSQLPNSRGRTVIDRDQGPRNFCTCTCTCIYTSALRGEPTQLRRGFIMQAPAVSCMSHASSAPSRARLTRSVHHAHVKAFVAGPKSLFQHSRHAKLHCQAQDRSSSVTDVQKIDTEKGGLVHQLKETVFTPASLVPLAIGVGGGFFTLHGQDGALIGAFCVL